MTDVAAVALEWAARAGPPNAVFVLALLTRPSTWSKRVVAYLNQYVGEPSEG